MKLTPDQYVRKTLHAVARELRRYRKQHAASEKFMAAALGITVRFYRRCEAGHGGRLKMSNLVRYCDLFPRRVRYVTLARLLGEPKPASRKRKSRPLKRPVRLPAT